MVKPGFVVDDPLELLDAAWSSKQDIVAHDFQVGWEFNDFSFCPFKSDKTGLVEVVNEGFIAGVVSSYNFDARVVIGSFY